ncbi:MAG: tetratricopeptide repeat protein [Candidatus Aminicenantes bacterium]|nr:tetratricopeptide repeat protein [Candidatus Aminicenantes bacterium]
MKRQSPLHAFFSDLRKKRIIEILAAFIGGGWLLVEVVERLLVGHYGFPEATIDLTVVSVIGALLATLVWRWFCGKNKRPGNIKVEILLVPLILLATAAIDLAILLKTIGVPGKTLLVAAVAICLGIAWVVLKSLQWAAAAAPLAPSLVLTSQQRLNPISTRSDKSIIVLPFENISPDPEQDYFCDGMTEEIITDLSHVHGLLVISRSSAMTFKGTKKTIPEIAHAVNVRYVMEGSVRKAGNDLRITAQLIDATSDAHIWAEKYVGSLEDVFAIQEKVSRSIAEALKLRLTPDEERQLRSRPIPDVRAYDAYLRAYYEVWRFTPEGFNRAFRILDQTLDQVGEFALIHAGLGYFQALAYDFGISHDPGTLVRAERHATRALELDPALGLAYCALGYVRYKQGDLPAYVKLARRAVELDRNTTALWMLAFSLAETGHLAQARQFAEEAVTADPLNIMSGFAQGAVEFFDGRFEEAASCFRRYLEIVGPDEPILLWWLAQALAYQGRENEAVPYFDKVIAAGARPLSALSRLWRLAAGGDREGFRKALESDAQLLETARTDEWFPNFIAACLARLGDHAGAIEWLGRAVGWGFSNYRFLSELSPFLAPIRGDRRFQALLEDARRKQEILDISPWAPTAQR